MQPVFDFIRNLGPFAIPILALCIPIVAIIVGGIVKLVGMRIRHIERMAMIRRGIHPDLASDKEAEEEKCC